MYLYIYIFFGFITFIISVIIIWHYIIPKFKTYLSKLQTQNISKNDNLSVNHINELDSDSTKIYNFFKSIDIDDYKNENNINLNYENKLELYDIDLKIVITRCLINVDKYDELIKIIELYKKYEINIKNNIIKRFINIIDINKAYLTFKYNIYTKYKDYILPIQNTNITDINTNIFTNFIIDNYNKIVYDDDILNKYNIIDILLFNFIYITDKKNSNIIASNIMTSTEDDNYLPYFTTMDHEFDITTVSVYTNYSNISNYYNFEDRNIKRDYMKLLYYNKSNQQNIVNYLCNGLDININTLTNTYTYKEISVLLKINNNILCPLYTHNYSNNCSIYTMISTSKLYPLINRNINIEYLKSLAESLRTKILPIVVNKYKYDIANTSIVNDIYTNGILLDISIYRYIAAYINKNIVVFYNRAHPIIVNYIKTKHNKRINDQLDYHLYIDKYIYILLDKYNDKDHIIDYIKLFYQNIILRYFNMNLYTYPFAKEFREFIKSKISDNTEYIDDQLPKKLNNYEYIYDTIKLSIKHKEPEYIDPNDILNTNSNIEHITNKYSINDYPILKTIYEYINNVNYYYERNNKDLDFISVHNTIMYILLYGPATYGQLYNYNNNDECVAILYESEHFAIYDKSIYKHDIINSRFIEGIYTYGLRLINNKLYLQT